MYAGMVRDMLQWHAKDPVNWEKTWELVVEKYRNDKNYYVSPLDVKQEGAFVLMGLLYGNGDLDKSMVIAMRCGVGLRLQPVQRGRRVVHDGRACRNCPTGTTRSSTRRRSSATPPTTSRL